MAATFVIQKKKKRMMFQIAIEFRGWRTNNAFEDFVNDQWEIKRATSENKNKMREQLLSRGSINHMINCDAERSMSLWIFVADCLQFPVKEIHEEYTPPDRLGFGDFWIGEEGGRIRDCDALVDKSSTLAKLTRIGAL